MDFSIILLLPFSALVAFVVVIAFAVSKRARPRLGWPFLLSLLAATPVFVGWPWGNPVWLLSLMIVAIWAAIGTVAGGLMAFLLIQMSVSLPKADSRLARTLASHTPWGDGTCYLSKAGPFAAWLVLNPYGAKADFRRALTLGGRKSGRLQAGEFWMVLLESSHSSCMRWSD